MITLSPHQDQAFLLKDYYGGAFAQQLVKTQRLARALVCVIVEEGQAAEKLQDEILFFGPNSKIETLPYYDVSPYSGLSPLRRTCLKNQCVLFCLLSGQLDFLIVPKHAALRRCLNKDIFSSLNITITKNDLIDRDELIQKLVLMGYERYSVVEEPGHFAVRGDILDVFSPQHEHPHRISFFDIEIETIKPFTAVNQRTLEAVSEIQLIPAHEIFLHHYHTTQQLREVPQTATTTPAWINTHWKSDLKKRADQKNIQKSKRDQIEEYVAHRIYFHGIEFFLPLFYHETGTVFDYFKPNAIIVTDLVEPFDKFTGCFLEELSKTQQASDHIESIFAPQDIFIDPKTLVEKLGPHPRLYRDTTGLEDLPA
ncbi:MAG TPA: hypothetical protein VJC18_02030, partial [bacterium]|nr:hypothetical protein [bacterium]